MTSTTASRSAQFATSAITGLARFVFRFLKRPPLNGTTVALESVRAWVRAAGAKWKLAAKVEMLGTEISTFLLEGPDADMLQFRT